MIRVITGPGVDPKSIEHKEGDTIATVLERAAVKLEEGEVAIVKGMAILNIGDTPAEDNSTIVIDTKPQNG